MSPVLIEFLRERFGGRPVPNIRLRPRTPSHIVRTGVITRCIGAKTSAQMDSQFTIKITLIYQSTI